MNNTRSKFPKLLCLTLLTMSEVMHVSQAIKIWSSVTSSKAFNKTKKPSSYEELLNRWDSITSILPINKKDSSSACEKLAAYTEWGLTARNFEVERPLSRTRLSRKSGGSKEDLLNNVFELASECVREYEHLLVTMSSSSSSKTNECSDSNNSNDSLDKVVCELRGGHSHNVMTNDLVTETVSAAAATLPLGLSLNVWKVIIQFFITSLNVLCWWIPLQMKNFGENMSTLGIANAFSGGVFLSLAFGHMIPECVHGFTGYNEVMPYMTVLAGYLLIFFVEKVAFDAHGILHEMEDDHTHTSSHHHHKPPSKPHPPIGSNNGRSVSTTTTTSEGSNSIAHSGRSAVILLGALAVHSILEMTALGLSNTFSDSALMGFSIGIHQPAESLALLVAFMKSGMSKDQIFKYLSIFSMFGPLGCFLGMYLNAYASPLVDAVMLALVAGTFIYVGATEVIPEEWEEPDDKWKKFFSLIGGILCIFGITQYTAGLEAGIGA